MACVISVIFLFPTRVLLNNYCIRVKIQVECYAISVSDVPRDAGVDVMSREINFQALKCLYASCEELGEGVDLTPPDERPANTSRRWSIAADWDTYGPPGIDDDVVIPAGNTAIVTTNEQ